MEAINNIY